MFYEEGRVRIAAVIDEAGGSGDGVFLGHCVFLNGVWLLHVGQSSGNEAAGKCSPRYCAGKWRCCTLTVLGGDMYIPADTLAAGGVESLAMINSLVKIMENLRKDKNTPKGFADVISQLESDAFVLSGRFIDEIGAWEASMRKANLDFSSRFVDLETTSVFWKNRHDKVLEAFEPTLGAIQKRLSSFMDDLIAIARCAGKEEILALSSQQAAALKEKLRTDTAVDKHSIKDILEVLLKQAEAFRGVLGTKK